MADEKQKKAPSSKTKTAAAAAAAAKATDPASAAASAAPGETCRAPKCKQPVRAKGYCRKHYLGWRRGDLGTKQRYKTCSKEGCRKKAVIAGRCEEHRKGGAAGEAAAAAAAS